MTAAPRENTPRHLGVLHYHLKGGGVYTVAQNQLRALAAADGPPWQVDIISSDADGKPGRRFCAELQRWLAGRDLAERLTLRPVEIPQLAYHQKPAPDAETFAAEVAVLTERLLALARAAADESGRPYALHVHNGNLGKNPRLTAALAELATAAAEDQAPLWILYQMHDFAEDQRPECWRALRRCRGAADDAYATRIMYPQRGPILWACINSADRRRLEAAGLSAERIKVLPNAVDVEAFAAPALNDMDAEARAQIGLKDVAADYDHLLRDRIAAYAAQQGYAFDAQRRILLAPIKAIRRKNVYESVLLLLALNRWQDDYALVITLPANSPGDIEYCSTLAEWVKQARLPVVIGVGRSLLKPGNAREIADGAVRTFSVVDMLHVSAAVVTTSIQEGFGYVFHEPWLARRAVTGRDLPRVTADFKAAGMTMNHLYDRLLVPEGLLPGALADLAGRYRDKLAPLRRAAGAPALDEEAFAQAFRHAKIHQLADAEGAWVDWADLSAEWQLSLLQEFNESSALLDRLRWVDAAGQDAAWWQDEGFSAIIEANQSVVESHYNLAATAERLTALLDRGSRLDTGQALSEPLDHPAIFADCHDLASLRLLM